MWILILLVCFISLQSCSFVNSSNDTIPFQEIVTFTIKNNHYWPATFDWLRIPCFQEWSVCVKHEKSDCLEYMGITGFSTDEEDFQELLWPGQSYTCTVNITDAFRMNMNQTGTYYIEYDGTQKDPNWKIFETSLTAGRDMYVQPRRRNSLPSWITPELAISGSNVLMMKLE